MLSRSTITISAGSLAAVPLPESAPGNTLQPLGSRIDRRIVAEAPPRQSGRGFVYGAVKHSCPPQYRPKSRRSHGPSIE